MDYKQAGVDVEAGDALVDWLKEHQPSRQPHHERLVAGIGGFAALFRVQFPNMKSPCLVTSTDGVGTKLKLASQYQRYREVAQDLVAMCVNDLICCGAQPLFFLDYYATGKLQLKDAKEFLSGVQAACIESDCALVGGETAEMPGVYHDGDFDCAGFAVGVVDEHETLGGHRVQNGDRLIGVASSGFHSNGYSLLRKIFEKDMDQWVERLLVPTHLYVKLVLSLQKQVGLRAVAHITGGGLDNILRVVPDGAQLQLKAWKVPPAFMEVKRRGQINWASLLRTLNCGMGLALVVKPEDFNKTLQLVGTHGFAAWDLGQVEIKKGQEKNWFVNEKELDGLSV